MSAVIGALRADLSASIGDFASGFSQAADKVQQFSSSFKRTGDSMQKFGGQLSLFVTAPIIAMGAHLLQGSQDAAAAAGQVNAALNSMGGASGKTAEELTKSAEALRDLSGVDDDEILKKSTANLLTFGNIAGKTFDRAQLAALNLSARMEGDLQGATMMVGKALNDPVKGLAALGRAGIQFTKAQKDQIKAMSGVGDMAGAQAIMLGELERQFSGAAKAAGDANIWTPLKTALMDLEGSFEPLIRDAVKPMVEALARLVEGFAALPAPARGTMLAIAGIAAVAGPVIVMAGTLISSFGAIAGALATMSAPAAAAAAAIATTAPAVGGVAATAAVASGALGALVAALLPVVAGVVAVGAVFYVFREQIAENLNLVWTILRDTLGGPLAALFQECKAVVQQFVAAFKSVMAGEFGDHIRASIGFMEDLSAIFSRVFGEVIARVLHAFVEVFRGAVRNIGNVINLVKALVTGDWKAAWTAAGAILKNAVDTMLNVVDALFPGAKAALTKMAGAVSSIFSKSVAPTFAWIGERAQAMLAVFNFVWSAITGGVARMYAGVRNWIADKLGPLIDWAAARIDTLRAAFGALADEARKPIQAPPVAPGDDWRDRLTRRAPPTITAPTAGDDDDAGGGSGGGSGAAAGANAFATALAALKEKLDPVQAAIAAYRESLAVAQRGGLDMASATNLLAREAVDAAGGWDKLKDRLDTLPPAVAAAAKAMRMEEIKADVQAIADMANPLAAAVRQYTADVALATEGGLRLADVEGAIAAKAFAAAGGLDAYREKLAALPPALRAVADAELAVEQAAYREGLMKTGDQLRLQYDATYAYSQEVKRLNELLAAGSISQQTYTAAMADAQQSFQRHLADTNPAIAARFNSIEAIGDALGGVADGTKSWGDAWKQLMKDLLKILVIEPIIERLKASLRGLSTSSLGGGAPGAGGGFLSGVMGFAKTIFGGFRAKGGPVVPGRAYMVGEEGPEPFIPKTAGTILPHGSLGDGGPSGGLTSITVNAPDAVTRAWITDAVQGAYTAAVKDGATAAVQIARRVIPEELARQQNSSFV